jgi:hypothetical protein
VGGDGVVQKSKEVAYQRAKSMLGTYLLFEGEDYKKQAELFGPDPLSFGNQAKSKNARRFVSALQRRRPNQEKSADRGYFLQDHAGHLSAAPDWMCRFKD